MIEKLDTDLYKILDGMWKIKPKVTIDYLKVESICRLTQAIRNK